MVWFNIYVNIKLNLLTVPQYRLKHEQQQNPHTEDNEFLKVYA